MAGIFFAEEFAQKNMIQFEEMAIETRFIHFEKTFVTSSVLIIVCEFYDFVCIIIMSQCIFI